MELSQYLQAFRAHWKLILASTLVGIAIAGAITLLITPTYTSSAQLFVNSSSDSSNAAQTNIVVQDKVPTYAELAGTQSFAGAVVQRLANPDITIGDVAGKLETVVNPSSVILSIGVTAESPRLAQAVANAAAEELIAQIAVRETGAPITTVDVNGVPTTTPDTPDIRADIAAPAPLPVDPVFPDPMVNLPLGLVVGLLIGLVLALVRYLLDNTVKSSKQIEELTGSTSIGGVLYDSDMASRPLVTQHKAQSITSEAYRQIRTNLQYVSIDNPPKVMVVTSSVSGEGKTTTAINLALVLAQSGQRVALVEADLRRPRVMRYLQLVGGAGLTNVLAGKADLDELLQPWGDGKLSVLAAGPNPPNPSELLGSEQMRHMLDELKATHDYVVIDAPPLLPVTDAAVLSVLSDGVVLVTRYGTTKREQLRAAASMVRVIDVRVLGTVLNMIPTRGGGGGDYGYGYGYGYAYEPDPTPRELLGKEKGRRAKGRTTKDIDTPATETAKGESAKGESAKGESAKGEDPDVVASANEAPSLSKAAPAPHATPASGSGTNVTEVPAGAGRRSQSGH
ncbi:MAG: polysaccharide biosynthesis tyrosine autokinase [Geodermatophilaceae bacterium]|nr:polysaccharide biosynthesis tyrosine autokinase [Geodermatophilaceae bacterium]